MDNPGVYELCALQIGAAQPQSLLTPIANLGGMTAATLIPVFKYGSGGSTFSAIVATSPDGGTTWLHIARWNFAMASRTAYRNLEGVLSIGADYADLASDNSYNDGLLCDRLAVILQSTGTYSNTTFALYASVR